jgi:hypothetical protein
MALALRSAETGILLPITRSHVAVAVDNARLMELELRRSRQVRKINHIGKQLNSALDAEKALHQSNRSSSRSFPYKYIDIFRLSDVQDLANPNNSSGNTIFRKRGRHLLASRKESSVVLPARVKPFSLTMF